MTKRSKTTVEFVEDAIKVHGNKYDYSNVQYENTHTKVEIICNEHGMFEQKPNSHLNGNNCMKCVYPNKIVSTKDFIVKANIAHNNKYDYSKAQYIKTKSKVTIICPNHGEFQQTAYIHLKGSECPKCSRSQISWNYVKKYTLNESLGSKQGTFYKLLFTHKSGFQFIKIGITSKSMKERYISKKYNDFTYIILEENKTTNLKSALLEKEFMKETELNKFKFPKNVRFDGHSECYECPIHTNPCSLGS